jgi:DNA replication protein DnaC
MDMREAIRQRRRNEAEAKWKVDSNDRVTHLISEIMQTDKYVDAITTDFSENLQNKLKSFGNYFITGTAGTGKTHLAVAILRDYLTTVRPKMITHVDSSKATNYDVDMQLRENVEYDCNDASYLPAFTITPELLLRIRMSYQDKANETELQIIQQYIDAPFLIIDDIGVEKATDFVLNVFYVIINRRYLSSSTVTIFTSNLSLDEIKEQLSERISSRIAEMCSMIKLGGRDRRIKN